MPELPEVETVRRALARNLPGRTIVAVSGRRVMMRRPLEPQHLAHQVVGRRLGEPRRRGKFLLLDTEPDGSLLVHLGMSGRLALTTSGRPMDRHTHLVLSLDDTTELRLVDPRRFGLAHWLAAGEEAADPSLARLGVEPLDADLAEHLQRMFSGRRAPVKSLLLDQTLVAGVGNIYATEALWRARIRPTRPGNRIAQARLRRLAAAVTEVLGEAVEAGGTTLRDFASPDGWAGYFAVHLDTYGRDGEPCRRCGTTLARVVIAGRSTAWCRRCQR